jgi:hypothetical protein
MKVRQSLTQAYLAEYLTWRAQQGLDDCFWRITMGFVASRPLLRARNHAPACASIAAGPGRQCGRSMQGGAASGSGEDGGEDGTVP